VTSLVDNGHDTLRHAILADKKLSKNCCSRNGPGAAGTGCTWPRWTVPTPVAGLVLRTNAFPLLLCLGCGAFVSINFPAKFPSKTLRKPANYPKNKPETTALAPAR
jgi:hypothetical protein